MDTDEAALGQVTLLHLDSLHHLIRQKVVLVDDPASPATTMEQAGSSTHLPLPNPFKAALKGLRSSDNLEQDLKEEDPGRIVLTNTIDLGILPLNGPVRALRTLDTPKLTSVLAWSSEELIVR
jgi:WD repeat-containing protein 7